LHHWLGQEQQLHHLEDTQLHRKFLDLAAGNGCKQGYTLENGKQQSTNYYHKLAMEEFEKNKKK
jgi:phage protein U